MFNVFIDGKEGTTGLQIYDRLSKRDDVAIMALPEELRKDKDARRECLNKSDISFLCLPDDAARESVSLVTNPDARIIDASTAHRTAEGWVYGLPEISPTRREEIRNAKKVANPGCHATGFITLVAPLVKGGIVPAVYPFTAHSISGYSGAGKKAIAQYESEGRDDALNSPRLYAFSQTHKHIPEMVKECSLAVKPIFEPFICDFYCGMCVTVSLFPHLMSKKYGVNDLIEYFTEYYARQNFIKVVKIEKEEAFLPANKLAGKNDLEIRVLGNDERIVLSSVFDNLGKGAAGAAVQNMNIMLGLDERTSLI